MGMSPGRSPEESARFMVAEMSVGACKMRIAEATVPEDIRPWIKAVNQLDGQLPPSKRDPLRESVFRQADRIREGHADESVAERVKRHLAKRDATADEPNTAASQEVGA